MKLHELQPAAGSRKVRNRVGRGTSFLLMSGAVGGWGGGDEARIELRWGD